MHAFFFFVVCGLFFKLTSLKKNLSGIPSECQTVWIQISPDILLGLIWVQTVCKGYQQMTKVATSGERVRVNVAKKKDPIQSCKVII